MSIAVLDSWGDSDRFTLQQDHAIVTVAVVLIAVDDVMMVVGGHHRSIKCELGISRTLDLVFFVGFLLLFSNILQEPDVVQIALIVPLLVLIRVRDPVVAIEDIFENDFPLHVLIFTIFFALDNCQTLEIDLHLGLKPVQEIVLVQVACSPPLVKVARDLDRGWEVMSVRRVREREQYGGVSRHYRSVVVGSVERVVVVVVSVVVIGVVVSRVVVVPRKAEAQELERDLRF